MELVTDADILTDMKARVANAVMLNMIPAGATATAITAAMNLMSVTQATPVAIVIAGNAMVGISETNALGAKTVKCTSCAGIGFESRKCSFLDDRVCTACTVCPYDTWTVQPCVISTPGNVGMDTVCYRCSSCTAGKFIRRPCGGGVETVEGTQTLWTGYSVLGNLVGTPTVQGADTYCRRCRTCNINTFETRPCEMGLDRQCQTCDSCTLSEAQEVKCRGSSVLWRRINCCWDTDKTHVKPCHDIPLEQFKISARDSRRDEVWCRYFDHDKKKCMDTMYQSGVVPLGGHIDETEHFDGTTSRYKAARGGKSGRIHLQDTNIPVQSYGDAADTNRVIPVTTASHESNTHPGTHSAQQTGTQNPATQFGLEHIHTPPLHGTGN